MSTISNLVSNISDLEQELMIAWNVVDDLDRLNEAVLEKDITRDEISTILAGLSAMYELKFQKAHTLLEELLKQG